MLASNKTATLKAQNKHPKFLYTLYRNCIHEAGIL